MGTIEIYDRKPRRIAGIITVMECAIAQACSYPHVMCWKPEHPINSINVSKSHIFFSKELWLQKYGNRGASRQRDPNTPEPAEVCKYVSPFQPTDPKEKWSAKQPYVNSAPPPPLPEILPTDGNSIDQPNSDGPPRVPHGPPKKKKKKKKKNEAGGTPPGRIKNRPQLDETTTTTTTPSKGTGYDQPLNDTIPTRSANT